MKSTAIPPHGGTLVNRLAQGKEKGDLEKKAAKLSKIHLTPREISDLEMIAIGAFSPLEGFLTQADYQSVVHTMHLQNGLVWSIPITLSVHSDERKTLKENSDVALVNEKGHLIGLLHLEEIYNYDKEKEAQLVYQTTDEAHPGVAAVYSQGEFLLGGKITLLNRPSHAPFDSYWFDPADTRMIFQEKGWERIVGFQTRNPIHRAHEFIIKCAMEIVDGLFLNPLVGETKKGDIPADVRMACYEKLVKHYFPRGHVFIGVYGAAMRYAGPREAVLHALVRKNFGCTHFIVGRDHAGVGNYYGSFDAQKIFSEFTPEEIGITPLFFDNSFYCRHCGEMATVKTCPHPKTEHLAFSGTHVREMLSKGEPLPPEFTRPETAEILRQAYREQRV